MIRWRHTIVFVVAMLTACAGTPQLAEVKEVYVCAASECGPASQRYSAGEMLRGLYTLFKQNEATEPVICESTPAGRNCDSEGVGYFVMGGPIPGRGSQSRWKHAGTTLNAADNSITLTVNNYLKFIGTSLACAETRRTIKVRSADEIVVADEPYYCNWAGVGNMTATFNFVLDYLDLDKGRVGGYWQHGVAGTGVGSGGGYGIVQFAAPMKKGDDWLKAQAP